MVHRPGDVLDLVRAADNATAVFGSGEEIAFEFEKCLLAAWEIVSGRVRTRGWCKDMDLFTKDGEQLLPGPPRALDELGRSLSLTVGPVGRAVSNFCPPSWSCSARDPI